MILTTQKTLTHTLEMNGKEAESLLEALKHVRNHLPERHTSVERGAWASVSAIDVSDQIIAMLKARDK